MLYLLDSDDLTNINNTITELSNNSREKAGDIKYSTKSSLSGYVLCNGSTVNSSQYPDLYNTLPFQTRLNGQYEQLSSQPLYTNYKVQYDYIRYTGTYYWTVGTKNTGNNYDIYVLYGTSLINLIKSPNTKKIYSITSSGGIDIIFVGSYMNSLFVVCVSDHYETTMLYSSSISGSYSTRTSNFMFPDDNAYMYTVTQRCLMGIWTTRNNGAIRMINVNTGATDKHDIDEFIPEYVTVCLPTGNGFYVQTGDSSTSLGSSGKVWQIQDSNSTVYLYSTGSVNIGRNISYTDKDGFFYGGDKYVYQVTSSYPTARKTGLTNNTSPTCCCYNGTQYYAIISEKLYYTTNYAGTWTEQSNIFSSYANSVSWITDNTSFINASNHNGWLENKKILPLIPSPSTNTQPVNAFIKTTN